MDATYFTLQDGSLQVDNEKIKISDRYRRNRVFEILLIISMALYAASCILRYFKEQNLHLLWLGILLLLAWLFSGYKLSKTTAQSDIQFSSISKIILKTLSTGKVSTKIILKDNKLRPLVLETEDGQDLKFIDLMQLKGITVIEKPEK